VVAKAGVGRQPRSEETGAIHHVFARGNRRQAIFADDRDRLAYLAMLGAVVRRQRWVCLAYCLMGNHVHLLIETPEANLGLGMMRLHGPYAQAFNRRHGTAGHLFQGRYGAERVESDAQLVMTLRYIALNPVEAGLCADAREWRWGSYAMVMEGLAPAWLDGARVVAYLATWGGDGRARFDEVA
jgi:REP element-mobilizing transposase RayT